jgi:hypothetical protein
MLSDEQLQNLRDSFTRNNADKPEGRDSEYLATLHLTPGTYLMRIHADPEGQVFRIFYEHSVMTDESHSKCQCGGDVEACPPCHKLGALKKLFPDMPTAWKFKAHEKTMCFATVIESSSDSKYVQLDVPMLVIGDYRLGNQLKDLMSQLSVEELRKCLSPEVPYPPIEIRIMKKPNGRGTTFSLGLSRGEKQVADPLPSNCHPLSACLYKQSETPDPKMQASFIDAMEKAFEKYRNRVTVLQPIPESQETQPATVAPRQPSQSVTHRQTVSPVQETVQNECFGQHPDQSNAGCLMCDYETECTEKTNSSVRRAL